ncbi:hypothetical protein BH11PLA1_BH11PLA1_01360 [soil metagenome]
MIRMILIPLLALAGFAFAVQTVLSQSQERPVAQPLAEPARSPYPESVAGSGIIEASTRNIAVGTNIAGVVVEVMKEAGAPVKAGEPLFRIDDRALKAELGARQAKLKAAQSQVLIARAQLQKQEALPRVEDVPPAAARAEAARALLSDAEELLAMMKAVADARAVVREEMTRRENAVKTARARSAESAAELAQLKAGAWAPDLAIAGAQIAQAEATAAQAQADVDQTKTELERLVVRAPVDGEVLQNNVRIGEYAQAGALTTPLMLVGNTATMHVRVDVDENDAWRIKPGARARVALRGNPQIFTEATTFVRVEPFVIPKRSLTGDSTERVDTRVLQIIYAFPRSELNAYVGQQVDVRIEAQGGAAVRTPGAAKS